MPTGRRFALQGGSGWEGLDAAPMLLTVSTDEGWVGVRCAGETGSFQIAPLVVP